MVAAFRAELVLTEERGLSLGESVVALEPGATESLTRARGLAESPATRDLVQPSAPAAIMLRPAPNHPRREILIRIPGRLQGNSVPSVGQPSGVGEVDDDLDVVRSALQRLPP